MAQLRPLKVLQVLGSMVLAAGIVVSGGLAATAKEAPLQSCFLDLRTMDAVCEATPEEMEQAIEEDLGLEVVSRAEYERRETAASGVRASAKTVTAAATAVSIDARYYEDADFLGAELAVGGMTCQEEIEQGIPNLATHLPNQNWSDVISSFKRHHGCISKLWRDKNYGGPGYGYVNVKYYVGDAYNDTFTSLKIK